ncbi:hypothetical protein I7X12_05255 [Halosimplex litoreum]|uniref:Uncharacterized protein n=1 Tax=Halosimplex litoreum TaxID=1198301 RepID=A0A7T3G0F5_9EURY|nr:hypothetical protein [Halosimplex litoreum]QPV64038.1 hypothetical protein I7X12_05255 [Halosimplex litoreum]
MEWTAYTFECADGRAREALVGWFDDRHPMDPPDDGDCVHGDLVDGEGAERPADLAWVGEYCYALTDDPVPGLLVESADRWERAAVGTFDSETETCTEAVLYGSGGDDRPTETARYEGEDGLAGQDMLYRFAMVHRFRFRAFAHAPPAPMLTEIFGAFDAVAGMGWESDLLAEFEAETGVEPTARGVEFLADDPVLDDGEFHETAEEE